MREIDALGGLMGRAIDATGIQFKMLNRSRGPAVWSPRAQADKRRYRRSGCARASTRRPDSTGLSAQAGVLVDGRAGSPGVALEDGDAFACRAVVVTTGHVPERPDPHRPRAAAGGRVGEPPSRELAESLKGFGFRLGPAEDRHAAAARIATRIDFAALSRGEFTSEPATIRRCRSRS